MSIRLLNITFNLSPGSTDGPSVTIRRNASDDVRLPEWRRDETVSAEQCPVAYSSAKARGQTVNIRVLMSGPAGRSFTVRALGPDRAEQDRLGCALTILYGLLRLLPFPQWQQLNMIGWVEPFIITFPETQRVDQISTAEVTVPLSDHRIGGTGVWVSNTSWRWQYASEPGSWSDIVTSRHRVYCLIDHPTRPWQQEYMGGDNPRLPWTNALDLACEWAAWSRTADSVASAMTRGVWDAGVSGLLRYEVGSSAFVSGGPLGGRFDLAGFLSHLRGGTGARSIECYDCAAAVSTLANLLGANLRQHQFSYLQGRESESVLLIGHGRDSRATWSEHEVASVATPPRGSKVWDACLQLNAAAPTAEGSFIGQPVHGMTFADYKTLFLGDEVGGTVLTGLLGHRDLVDG